MTDPFAHHPELRSLMTDPEASVLPALSFEALEAKLSALGLPVGWWYPEEEREALRAATMADWDGGDLWVFGYGSLMWDPGFRFAEVRRAFAPVHARRFILRDVYGARGTHEAPGLMAALDDGAGCEGLAFRIEAGEVETATWALWRRERIAPGYLARLIEVRLSDGPRTALTFVADHAAEMIASDITRAEQVRYLATGTGFLGTSLDYIRNVASHFAALGIEDTEVTGLLAEVEAWTGADPDD